MIQNSITKTQAYAAAMSFIEETYKLDVEEIYDHIKKAANNGKFYCRYYIFDDTKTHSLTYYFKNQGYSCNDNYDYKKDENNKVIRNEDGTPIKDRIWIDIFWNL